jgi:hypothetical protein
MANRIWQMRMGTGLVRTPNDFGSLGERPTNRELLDWLATEFVRDRLGLDWERVWVTVHAGDPTLALGRICARIEQRLWPKPAPGILVPAAQLIGFIGLRA